jgi:hypothetical protein
MAILFANKTTTAPRAAAGRLTISAIRARQAAVATTTAWIAWITQSTMTFKILATTVKKMRRTIVAVLVKDSFETPSEPARRVKDRAQTILDTE